MHWVIQENIFGEETDRLIPYCRSVQVLSPESFPTNSCLAYGKGVVVRGSTKFVGKTNPIFFNLEKYSQNYTAHIDRKVLLNSDASIILWGAFKHHWVSEHERLFIRPFSGEKIFTGTTIGHKWHKKECEIIEGLPSTSGLTDDTLIVFAKEKKIFSETRFLVGPGGIVDDSHYNGVPPSSMEWLEQKELIDSIDKTKFDPFFTVDTCLSENGPAIVEVNSFNCAGLYDMNMIKVVRALENHG